MDYLLQILFWCPRCWRSIGRLMFIGGAIPLPAPSTSGAFAPLANQAAGL